MEISQMNYEFCDGITHTIKKGDTLYEISRQHNVPLALILRANPYVDVFNLQVGETLCIPTDKGQTKPYPGGAMMPSGGLEKPKPQPQPEPDENSTSCETSWKKYVVKPGETLEDVLQKSSGDVDAFIEKNGLANIYMLPGVAYYICEK
jgi:LysM repeat protein